MNYGTESLRYGFMRCRTTLVAKRQARHFGKILMSLGLGNDASILEAGCGVGGYLPLLAEFGTVKAFEPSDFASPHLGKHEGIAEITTGRSLMISLLVMSDLISSLLLMFWSMLKTIRPPCANSLSG